MELAGYTENELQVLKPPPHVGEHVQLGPLSPGHPPAQLGLHAHTDFEVVTPEGPVAVLLLVARVLW